MPSSSILPITGLDQVGLVVDQPAPSLPPNAFSDALNVRFRDGTIRKMQGEVNLFPNLFDDAGNLIDGVSANFDGSLLKYVVFWPNPNLISENGGYYLVIAEETRTGVQKDIAYLVSIDGTQKVEKGVFTAAEDGEWSHTFFQGGFAIIINNELDVPSYILDEENNTDINAVPNFLQLPGWESYEVNQVVLQDSFNPNEDSYIFDLGQQVDFDITEISVQRINSSDPGTVVDLTANGDTGVAGTPNNPSWTPPAFSTMTTTPWTTDDEFEIYNDTVTGTTVLNFPSNLSITGTDTITVAIRSRNPVEVRCRVIRAFGDFLVAGDLIERDELTPELVVRSLPGVIRTSDVAKPGAVPNNWNPFAAGVSTADEFVVSETAAVKDMVEMQGNMYVYTSSSISVMRLTGSAALPIAIQPVTDSYGCQNTNAVLEFEGKSIVVGSKDIYLFSGSPAGIQSVANDRVRRYFFQNMNPLGQNRVFLIDNKQRDEIWVCYPTRESVTGDCDEALIWNYRNNTWTKRELRGVVSGSFGPVPGGGLPFANIDLTGTTGDNGVTNVGSYEVRTMGISPASAISAEQVMYDGTGIYTDTSRGSYDYRPGVGNAQLMYQQPEMPEITVSGPEGTSLVFRLTHPYSDPSTVLTASEIWTQIQTQLATLDGWTFDSLPTGYVQETASVRLFATKDGSTSALTGKRDVAPSIAFDITVSDIGNTVYGPDLLSNMNFKESTVDADIHGVTVDGAVNDWRGSYVKRATPTILGIQIRSPSKTGGQEMLFLSSGDTGDYDPATHTGSTNGVTYTDEQTAEAWIDKIRVATSRLVATDEGSAGEFSIQPASFGELSDYIIDMRINDTVENGQWLWDRYQETVNGTIALNPYSDTPWSNPVAIDLPETQTIEVASNAPAIAGILDTQFSQDPARDPDYVTNFTTAAISAVINVSNVYSVDRPWDKDIVNPNLEFPIFASRQRVDGPTSRPVVNKILGADIGWSVPAFDYTPRVVTADSDNFYEIITNNDAPIPYESYFERLQGNISPDNDVETIHQFSIWASGVYNPYLNSEDVFNRLQLRIKATDNPGKVVDLTTLTDDTVKKNQFFISESNKVDTRVTGRYLNYRITDEILDRDDNVLTLTVNPKNSNNVAYTQLSNWEVSGMQPEVNKGGRR